MSLLPTAHAGQAYGARRIDFFTVSGEVSRSDDATGRIRDDDGMDHDIRLAEHTSALAPGDSATILRVQAGPNRRSRPVAIVNHSRETWLRAAPDATSLLARSGITRAFNWWLSVLLLALTALASVWPLLHAFLTEMNGAMMSGVPAYSVLGELDAYAPALAGWRLENALPSGLLDAIAALGVVPMDQLTEWGLALGATALAAIAYGARSWRLLYVPVFAGFAIMAGVILGGPGATLALIGGAVLLFLAGGLFNRIRDAGRFNARVERLSEHVLRNPPQESVRTADVGAADEAAAALAGTGAATALAGAAAASDETGAGSDDDDDAGEPASPGDDAANGEAEAGPELELPPAAADPAVAATTETSARPDEAGEAVAAGSSDDEAGEDESGEDGSGEDEANPASGDAAAAASQDAGEETGKDETGAAAATQDENAVTDEAVTEDTAPEETATEEADQDFPAEPAAAADEAGLAGDEPSGASDETAPAASAAEAPETGEAADAASDTTNDTSGEDDDLPSLDAVAAAAALTAAEQTGEDAPAAPSEDGGDETASATGPEEDERTMPLASPPPMPASDENTGENTGKNAGESGEDTPPAEAASGEPESAAASDDTPAGDAAPETGPDTQTDTAASPALVEVEDRVAAAVEAAGAGQQAVARPPVDDPLVDDSGNDPMLPKSQAGDTAPGAPDLDVDREETEPAS